MPLAWADVSGLTGGKISRLPAEFCVFTVFFISGFWHGNTLPFVAWGLLQASYRLARSCCTAVWASRKRKPRPACCGPSAPVCLYCGA